MIARGYPWLISCARAVSHWAYAGGSLWRQISGGGGTAADRAPVCEGVFGSDLVVPAPRFRFLSGFRVARCNSRATQGRAYK